MKDIEKRPKIDKREKVRQKKRRDNEVKAFKDNKVLIHFQQIKSDTFSNTNPHTLTPSFNHIDSFTSTHSPTHSIIHSPHTCTQSHQSTHPLTLSFILTRIHDRQAMQRRLPIEQHHVAVHQMALNQRADNELVRGARTIAEFEIDAETVCL
jgi:hypothetical protein